MHVRFHFVRPRGVPDEKNVPVRNCFNEEMSCEGLRRGRDASVAVVVLLPLAMLFAGCARKKPSPLPAPVRPGWTESGIASWYGHPYHGRRAASGEVYDMEKMTAAHRTLPFGTWVEVNNLANGRTARVRITDRGPFVGDRIIDLSKTAAREIAMIGPGTARVRLTVVQPPETPSLEEWYSVQAGAFRDRSNAERLRRRMQDRFGEARLVRRDGDPPVWRVLVGREPTPERAAALAERLREELGSAFVVRLDQTDEVSYN
jgi:rare lipoprotein A